MRFAKPLDEELLHQICNRFKTIVTIEDGVKKGGFGAAIMEFATNHEYKNKIEILGIEDVFTEHGTIEELQQINGIDVASIVDTIKALQ